MQLSKYLQIIIASAAISNAQELPEKELDLSLEQLPKATSYQEVLNDRYASLGFTQVEIDQIFQKKAEIRAGQTTWPAYTDFSNNVDIIVGEQMPVKGNGILATYDRSKNRVYLSENVAALGSTAMLLILGHELMHSCQIYNMNVRDFAFTPDTQTRENLVIAEEKLAKIQLELNDLDFDISKIKFEDLPNLIQTMNTRLKMQNRLLERLLGKSTATSFQEDRPSQKIMTLLTEYNEVLVNYRNSIYQDYYLLAKDEIDPRLSNINYYWMEHQKEQGQKPAAVLHPEQAKEAFDWFINQKFTFNTKQLYVQNYIKRLLVEFEIDQREQLIKELLERACGLASLDSNKILIQA